MCAASLLSVKIADSATLSQNSRTGYDKQFWVERKLAVAHRTKVADYDVRRCTKTVQYVQHGPWFCTVFKQVQNLWHKHMLQIIQELFMSCVKCTLTWLLQLIQDITGDGKVLHVCIVNLPQHVFEMPHILMP